MQLFLIFASTIFIALSITAVVALVLLKSERTSDHQISRYLSQKASSNDPKLGCVQLRRAKHKRARKRASGNGRQGRPSQI